MKKAIYVLFFGLTLLLNAQNGLKFEFDYARFNYDSVSVYCEFYYELDPQNMLQSESDKGKMIEAIVHIEMKNTATDQFFINKNWKINNLVSDSAQKTLSGVFGFIIPEGKYSLIVKAYDSKNTALSKTIEEIVNVVPFKTKKYSVSDLQLANRIKKEGADPKSIFYKNTLEIYPNPSMTYTSSSPVLFFYSELYDLQLDSLNKTFNLQRILYNSQGTEVYKISKNIKQSKSPLVEVGSINLGKFPTDSYALVLSLIDPGTKQAFISTKRFFYYNPTLSDSLQKTALNAQLLGSEYAVYTIEDCDQMFSQIKYIASKNEIEQYKKIDSLSTKREFLFQFWKNRDREPLTQKNETKEDYMRLVNFANEHFGSFNKAGYLTDRGRVLLIYGEPDQKDMYTNEPNLKPYEIWFYNSIEGGVSFVFGDVTGFGNYELLHSTKIGEITDDNWRARLTVE